MDFMTNPQRTQPVAATAIVATLVADEDARLRCLPRVGGAYGLRLECAVYDMLRHLSPDYDGGAWDFYTLSNGGFFMAPRIDGPVRLRCDNGYTGEAGARTAGIVACAMAYSHLSFLPDGACFVLAYYQLSDFIFQQPDVALIRAALD